MYDDGLITRENTLDEVRDVKKESVELFQKEGFIFHKWNSNVSTLERNNLDAEI